MRTPCRLLLAMSVAASALSPVLEAQSPSHTLPKGFTTREGNVRHWIPSHFAAAKAQTTYLADEIDRPTGMISRLSLRPNGDEPVATGHSFRVTIHMSSVGVPAPDQCRTDSFLLNRGTDRQLVLDDALVQFPGHTSGSGPEPWLVDLPITPFFYTAGNHLQIEWEVRRAGSGPGSVTWFCDAVAFVRPSSFGYFQRQNERNACPDRYTVHAGEVGGPGQLMSVWWYSGSAPGLPAAVLFSETDQNWDGIPLPFDLAPLGFPGCQMYVAPRAAVTGLTDNDGGIGRFRLDMPVPAIPGLARAEMFTQSIVADPSVPGGFRFSDRGRIIFGNVPVAPLGARHLYSYQFPLSDLPEFSSDLGPVVGLN